MGEHLALHVDNLAKPKAMESHSSAEVPESSDRARASHASMTAWPSISNIHSAVGEKNVEIGIPVEEEPLIQGVECRICQEEDSIKNLDTPCACSGSLKYAHRACLQRWINEKGDLTCEICHEPYRSGYVAPPQIIPDQTAIDISGWGISGTPFDLHDPRLLAMAAAQRHFLEAEFDEYAARNASGASFCRSAALILMALLLLRHALSINDTEGEDDASTFFFLFLLRAAGFLLPCYIMAWAISILQRLRERQEVPELAAAASEVTFILQPGQPRGLQFAISPDPPASPQRVPRL
ncbi:unnamed protein product [Spirodela intermedia]|uniref:RING-CH-type domain-containing protein n=1 Tax=Spirodela intermedia TaxID=51605 RepID=A0A7I8KVU3_SPIIN|nr:unnamed protein product [Spirodela intermedia]